MTKLDAYKGRIALCGFQYTPWLSHVWCKIDQHSKPQMLTEGKHDENNVLLYNYVLLCVCVVGGGGGDGVGIISM